MIGSLRGVLLDRSPEEILIEVAGVGHRVVTAPATALALGETGSEVFVWVHHHVREDAEVLYGFATRDEQVCFEALLGAHGVGPSMALAILSVHGPAALVRVLHDEDVGALCLVPGVGRKTAARLLIELRSRLDRLDPVPGAGGDGAGATIPGPQGAGGAGAAALPGNGLGTGDGGPAGAGASPSPRADVRAALAELGYGPDEVRSATAELPDEGDTGTLLRAALAQLAAGAG